jgi:hypothetical protein
MGVSVVGALAAAGTALWDKISATDTSNDALAGKIILGVAIVYGILVLVGFQWRTKDSEAS